MTVAVIGGGAAGLIAALECAKSGRRVILFERNEKLGKKIYITGKGRCNFTNLCSIEVFLTNVVRNGRFLNSALNNFTPADCVKYFENLGMPSVIERGNRAFPASSKASDVTAALFRALTSLDVDIRYNSYIKSFKVVDKSIVSLNIMKEIVLCDSVILATGGKTYPLTGSDGNGYDLAKSAGHNIIEPKPSLVPFIAKGCKELEGLSLKNVTLSLADSKGKILKSVFGELLFTADGISGPAALTLSAYCRDFYFKNSALYIDLKPALDDKTLDARLLKDFALYANKNSQNALVDLLPQRLIDKVLNQCQIDAEQKVNVITAKQRASLLSALKALRFDCLGLESIERAVVTSGGVDVKEVNPKTMQSKYINNLYFAGEILDVDALTGGYNLQIAFSTGFAAGRACAQSKD